MGDPEYRAVYLPCILALIQPCSGGIMITTVCTNFDTLLQKPRTITVFNSRLLSIANVCSGGLEITQPVSRIAHTEISPNLLAIGRALMWYSRAMTHTGEAIGMPCVSL